jgi:calcineurin-like phosphoesterase family protein
MIYFTSDQHFCHYNIIKYANRPFSSVREMNDTMASRWNSVVNEDDTVYMLGDWAMAGQYPGVFESYLRMLKGNIVTILGNHDGSKTKNALKRMGKEIVTAKRFTITIDGYSIIMTHKPIPAQNLSKIYLHGHIHSTERGHNPYCVCVEAWDYGPVSIDTIVQMFRDDFGREIKR